jgi:menaquinone-specific isochorismate synthase
MPGRLSLYDLGEKTLVAVSTRIDTAIDPFSALDALKDTWAFFWKGKHDTFPRLMLGRVSSVKHFKDKAFAKLSAERWVCALPFESDLTQEGLHEDASLGEGCIYLPELEVEVRTRYSIVRVRGLISQPAFRVAETFDADAFLSERLACYLPLLTSHKPRQMAMLKGSEDLPSVDFWRNMVDHVKCSIDDSQVHKVVLSRHKKLMLDKPQKIGSLLEKLSSYNEESYLFAIVHPSGDCFLGRSPEKILAWDNNDISVDAIAGTRKRHQDRSLEDDQEAEALKGSQKDLIEHRFVSDYVKALLELYADDVTAVESERIFRLRCVQHLKSSFQAKRKEKVSPYDLLVALHPTPAVGGFPKVKAMAMIAAQEPIKRGLFAGVIGVGDEYRGDFAIGIRTAFLSGSSLLLHAGAGIVRDSDASSEWEEIELKMNNFLNLYASKV